MSEAQTQHDRDSQELRRLCSERDALKAELQVWRATVWAIARELNCLPSTYADANGHVLKAAINLNARLHESEKAQQAQAPWWQLVPEKITEEQHVAACKVLLRANGMDGLPQRMLDAIRAAAPQQGSNT